MEGKYFPSPTLLKSNYDDEYQTNPRRSLEAIDSLLVRVTLRRALVFFSDIIHAMFSHEGLAGLGRNLALISQFVVVAAIESRRIITSMIVLSFRRWRTQWHLHVLVISENCTNISMAGTNCMVFYASRCSHFNM